ncbi:hypothetical protein L596_010398 [Steinernema carpocapsae]|uniref:Transmembrane protein n=1 Tax=Steinernema carpocapsae TaxID=34508 RepID=A0A4U5PI71_STECR|nr:hypothetical protein L596_010398 [Steinernema carpocapsae]
MLTFAEFLRWTGITVFEVWVQAIALIVSTVFLGLKIEFEMASISYYEVFAPLLVASAINYYFLLIIFIRSFVEEKECRAPFLRFAFSWLRVIMIAIFEVLLCYKINGDLQKGELHVQLSYGVVFIPIWLIILGLLVQACRLL